MASLVLGAAGAGIGAGIGGTFLGMSAASIGWTVGSTIGSLLSGGAPDQQGPRLSDLQIQDSSYGRPIPIVYGRDRLAGNIIWSKPLEEVKNEESAGGKGSGPTVTTYNYFATFALGLCEGEILGVRRIWIDSKLVYKFTDDATVEELLASNSKIQGITVYTGSSSQSPDPTIQAHKGAANTPAFRDTAYLVFERLDVGSSGRIPNISVEVIGDGATSIQGYVSKTTLDTTFGDLFFYQPHAIQKYNEGTFWLHTSRATGQYETAGELELYTYEVVDQFTINGEKIDSIDMSNDATDNVPATELYWVAENDYLLRKVGFNQGPGVAAFIDGDYVYVWSDTTASSETIGSNSRNIILGWGAASNAKQSNNGVAREDLTQKLIDAGASSEHLLSVVGTFEPINGEEFLYVFTGPTIYAATKWYLFELSGGQLEITETGTCSGMTFSQPSTTNTWHALCRVPNSALGGTCTVENKNYLWAAHLYSIHVRVAFIERVGSVFTLTNLTGGYTLTAASVPVTFAIDGICFVVAGSTLATFSRNPVITTSDATLSNIVSDICSRAGLSASDVDVTDLTDSVAGYTVTSVMSARAAIDPLMTAYHFDGPEYGGKVNFIKRGGASVTTIAEEDLGASISGQGEAYLHTRQQESELPSEVVVNYKDVNRDFQPAAQRSRRINTNVENVMILQLAIAMSADEAKQIAEILHYNAWTEREKFELMVTNDYLTTLKPSNVMQFTADGDTRKVRIAGIKYGSILTLSCVAESAAYTSTAAAGESESVEQTLGLVGPTNLQLLDIPMLRNNDNDTAIYLVASGYYAAWSGCRVYKSSDDASYQEVDALFNSATQGYASGALADHASTLWDRTNTVTVVLTSGSLSSATETNVLKGANRALLGTEVISFANATDNGDGSYTLDTLLRGRRGTDWATGDHAAGDVFVLFEAANMSRIEAVLSTARYFKGVSIGNYLVNASSTEFTNTGVSLKPFSPFYIKGARDGSNNLTISWQRRSRYIGGGLQPLPLLEDSEEYKVEILDAPGGSVLRTLTNPTSETATYSAANQTADGLTPGDPVNVKIYQISATVGAGYGKEATI